MIPDPVFDAFPVLAAQSRETISVERIAGGLINQTFDVRAGRRRFVLQRVSDVFSPEIHDNIDAVTRHLAARGFPCLELFRTRDDELSAALGDLGRWRLSSHLEGVAFERVPSIAAAHSAGALVGRFHRALDDFDTPLAPLGIPFRDTAHYRRRLQEVLRVGTGHPLSDRAAALARDVGAAFDRLGPAPRMRDRVIHGDLKISNVLFAGPTAPDRDRAVALIDFDTLLRAPLWSEWGDAWRSWCDRRGEEVPADAIERGEARFDLDVFAASVEGFAAGYDRTISRAERDSLVLATERLALELATRFLTDVFEESYFAWDANRYASAGDHNLARAEGQLALFEAAWACRAARAGILSSALG